MGLHSRGHAVLGVAGLACTHTLVTASGETVRDVLKSIQQNNQKTWEGGKSFLNLNSKISEYSYLLGSKSDDDPRDDGISTSDISDHGGPHPFRHYFNNLMALDDFDLTEPLPTHFDAKKHWKECADIIGLIRDQGNCGSCWAVAVAGMVSDRLCIATKGKIKRNMSAEDLLSCCEDCGGCHGGYNYRSWNYFEKHGLVTGGLYGDTKTCMPFSRIPCEHHVKGPRKPCPVAQKKPANKPPCPKKCVPQYKMPLKLDKYYGGSGYDVEAKEETIMRELMTHGPVTVSASCYHDIYLYRKGIYHHTTNHYAGDHAMRLVGWGEEMLKGHTKPTKYWLIANSWNTDWGENGYFRWLRGTNEGLIRDGVMGGRIDLSKLQLQLELGGGDSPKCTDNVASNKL